MTSRIPENVMLTRFDVLFSQKLDVVGSVTRLPFAHGSFDVAVFDPPYMYYGMPPKNLRSAKPSPTGMSHHTSIGSPEEFRALAMLAAIELFGACRRLCFVKVANTRKSGALIDNRGIIVDAFVSCGWTLFDELIFIRTGTGIFSNPTKAQNAHGFLLIFSKS